MELLQKLIISLVVGLLVIVGVLYAQKSILNSQVGTGKYRRPGFFILGQNNSGKTALFYRLTDGEDLKFTNTVSSLEPSFKDISIPFSKPSIGSKYQLIDYPGHLKYYSLLSNLMVKDVTLPKIRGIVYVIDSSYNATNSEILENIARQLFRLLPLTESVPNGIDFLFAINKQDLFDSVPIQKIRLMVEKELTTLIKNDILEKKFSVEDNEEDSGENDYDIREFWSSILGSQEAFNFSSLEGNMDFIGGSVLKNKIEPWKDWFDEKAVN